MSQLLFNSKFVISPLSCSGGIGIGTSFAETVLLSGGPKKIFCDGPGTDDLPSTLEYALERKEGPGAATGSGPGTVVDNGSGSATGSGTATGPGTVVDNGSVVDSGSGTCLDNLSNTVENTLENKEGSPAPPFKICFLNFLVLFLFVLFF